MLIKSKCSGRSDRIFRLHKEYTTKTIEHTFIWGGDDRRKSQIGTRLEMFNFVDSVLVSLWAN